jgi:16S rRNA (cytosine967-C5)-methyltransferase
LKSDGIFVYASCSLLPAENEQQIAAFVASHKDAELIPITAHWGIDRSGCRQLFPNINGHDGFFYAKIRKKL